MRLVFAGTPEFAALQLKAILDDGQHSVAAVYTQPDRPAGRGKKLLASPVKQLALEHDIPVLQPKSLKKADAQQQLIDLKPELLVVVAYGLILPQAVLDIPERGCVNVHASLLPRWRGAAPIQRAIEAGDTETGITLMQMDAGLDTGAMLLKHSVAIEDNDTGGSLHDKLAALGQQTLTQGLNDFDALTAEIQNDEDSTYASKINKLDAVIDWQDSAQNIAQKVRAMNPVPVCTAVLGEHKVKIWEVRPAEVRPAALRHEMVRPEQVRPADDSTPASPAPGTIVHASKTGITVACGKGHITITTLQLPGKRAMTSADMLNARAELFAPGQRFSQ